MATAATSDQNLLFGMLALQMDFIRREELLAAMNAWVLDKSLSLGQILVRDGQLTPQRRKLLEALLQEHLEQHDNNPRRSLAAVAPLAGVREELSQLADTDIEASLAEIASSQADADPFRTLAVGVSTSAGLRFRVLRPHAKGGLGQVSVALDEELSREVALKEIQPRYADDPQSRARFVMEAEITGGLEHPGIVPVYGMGCYSDGRPYYAMRFIKGDSLKDAIERFHQEGVKRAGDERTSELRKLLTRVVDACNAVAYAHSRDVLHRDIKPANIMLGRYGETLVVDWGLAKVLGSDEPNEHAAASQTAEPEESMPQIPRRRPPHDEQPLRPLAASGSAPTQFGATLGTPQYMSPEQAQGRLDRLSPVSDVYSLGATLYCVLTGQSPFETGDLTETLQRAQTGRFPPPRQVNKDIPAALEAICLKAMALAPSDRYRSPLDLADDIEHWLGDEPVSAYLESWRQRVARWSRRHRAWTQAAAMALVLMAATALISAAVIHRAWDSETEARFEVSQLLEQEKLERASALRMSQQADLMRHEAELARHDAESSRRTLEEAQTELARQITQLGLEEQLRRTVQSKPLLWEIAADRIEALHEKARVPTSADTSMQSYPAFRRDTPARHGNVTTLYLLPLGTLDESTRQTLEQTRDLLSRFYDLPVQVLPEVPRFDVPTSEQRSGPRGLQLRANWLLDIIVAPRSPSDAAATIAFTSRDLADDASRSTFAVTDPARPLAVVSWNHFLPLPGQPAAEAEFVRRTQKIAVYATGLAVGIRDFAAYECGMNTPRDLAELDRRPLAFCPECEQKIWWLSDAEPLERYRLLVEFAMRHNLPIEQQLWQRSLDAVRGTR